jgi:hypothetical protein
MQQFRKAITRSYTEKNGVTRSKKSIHLVFRETPLKTLCNSVQQFRKAITRSYTEKNGVTRSTLLFSYSIIQ